MEKIDRKSSPRLWGCFQRPLQVVTRHLVFPTPVGVFLIIGTQTTDTRCLPHACGGVSGCIVTVDDSLLSSPRLWGCFYQTKMKEDFLQVFPTPVGVFLWKKS